MAQLYVAFFIGRGRWHDQAIRALTRAPQSHCELVRAASPPGSGRPSLCLSASIRDGGVREKIIALDAAKWDVVPVPWAPEGAWDRARAEIGRRYDYAGLLLTQALNLRWHAPERWFCSELCAYALGLGRPHSYSPGDLHRQVIERGALVEQTRASLLAKRGGDGYGRNERGAAFAAPPIR